jgi:hypothetical protein
MADVLSNASPRVVLVAPFVKIEVFEAVLAAVPKKVDEVLCVTRWSVAEVAAGVSDPEIINIAEQDGRTRIVLCHDLHAKLFLGDDRCLVGSANLTGKATGRIEPENIELLVEVPATHPEVQRLLSRIDATAVPATSELATRIRNQANLFKDSDSQQPFVVAEEPAQSRHWYPATRAPGRLYPVYQGYDSEYPRDVLEGIVSDLTYLDLPPGLDESHFAIEIKARLHAMPEIQTLLSIGRLSSDDLQQVIAERAHVTKDEARRTAENIAAWLRYFDDVHTVPVGPWEIRRGRELA